MIVVVMVVVMMTIMIMMMMVMVIVMVMVMVMVIVQCGYEACSRQGAEYIALRIILYMNTLEENTYKH